MTLTIPVTYMCGCSSVTVIRHALAPYIDKERIAFIHGGGVLHNSSDVDIVARKYCLAHRENHGHVRNLGVPSLSFSGRALNAQL